MRIHRFALGFLVAAVTASSASHAQRPGFDIIQITDDAHFDAGGMINRCGQMAFFKRMGASYHDQEVFLYDNGRLTQLTDNDTNDALPDINDAGTILWTRIVDTGHWQVVEYVDGTITIIADSPNSLSGIRINNPGDIVWKELTGQNCGAEYDLFLFDGNTMEQITDNGLANQIPSLNDVGDIAWTKYDFCPWPWESEVMLRSGGQTISLPHFGFEPQTTSGAINSGGKVVWTSGVPPPKEHMTHLWEDGVATTVIDWGAGAFINRTGYIAFSRWYGDTSSWQSWLYRRGELVQVTNDSLNSYVLDFNDWGEMVLIMGHYPNTDLRFVRRTRTGDSGEGGLVLGFDGDIDLRDFAVLQRCLTGPGSFDRLCDCRFLDIDHDRDVDLDDFTLFTNAMTGPG